MTDIEELRHDDINLREAIRRNMADGPELSADFSSRLQQRLKPTAAPRWSRFAAVACLLVLIGVGITLIQADGRGVAEDKVTAKVTVPSKHTGLRKEVMQSGHPEGVGAAPVAEKMQAKRTDEPDVAETVPMEEDNEYISLETSDSNLHSAVNSQAEDDACEDPGRVNVFIKKFAALNRGQQVSLPSSEPADSDVVCTAYVFPDKKEVDVFGRMLQVACFYDSDTPGYILNYSRQQLFFSIENRRKDERYLWIAERIDGKCILLYCSHSPIETDALFSNYRKYYERVACLGIYTSQF